MKRLACIILALALLMAGCAATTAEQTNSTPTTEAAYTSTPAPTHTPTPAQTPTPTPEPTPAFNLEAYKAKVALSSQEIYDTATVLYTIAVYENTWWETMNNFGGNAKSEDIVSHAMENVLPKVDLTEDDLDRWHKEIQQQYKEISLVETEGKEAEKIAGYYEEIYEGYKRLHDIVFSPSGKQSSFESTFKGYAGQIVRAYDNLDLFLE